MTIQEFTAIIQPIPANVFAKTMQRLLIVDQRLALEAKRQQELNSANADAATHQAAVEDLTTQINALQTQIDALS